MKYRKLKDGTIINEYGDDVTPIEGRITAQTDVMREEIPLLPEDKVSPPEPHVPLTPCPDKEALELMEAVEKL